MPPDLEFIELENKSDFLTGMGVEKKDKREFPYLHDCATDQLQTHLLWSFLQKLPSAPLSKN